MTTSRNPATHTGPMDLTVIPLDEMLSNPALDDLVQGVIDKVRGGQQGESIQGQRD